MKSEVERVQFRYKALQDQNQLLHQELEKVGKCLSNKHGYVVNSVKKNRFWVMWIWYILLFFQLSEQMSKLKQGRMEETAEAQSLSRKLDESDNNTPMQLLEVIRYHFIIERRKGVI